MKIRNGFVSNSSSSSFVLIAKKLELPEEIMESALKGNKILVRTTEHDSDGSEIAFDYYDIENQVRDNFDWLFLYCDFLEIKKKIEEDEEYEIRDLLKLSLEPEDIIALITISDRSDWYQFEESFINSEKN